jgi:hypothetical protein
VLLLRENEQIIGAVRLNQGINQFQGVCKRNIGIVCPVDEQ